MREILFRGKRIDNGEWAYGNFVMDATEQVQRENIPLEPILADGFIRRYELAQQKIVMHEIDRETVGQYTGLNDKNGKKIFEGDLVRFVNPETGELSEYVYEVFWDDDYVGFRMFFHKTGYREAFDGVPHWYVVVGNIHDNPELLKGD